HAIEIMACPGGCIDGGGQPLHHGNSDIIKARWEAIYRADREMPIRKSHELLHTHYFDRQTTVEVDLDK
ncbi:MAG: iron hydrogenase small subunit, partial [Bacteroidales bacterium]|nr:iron hydrogenase small subunit [Bacteroidales bacterium]